MYEKVMRRMRIKNTFSVVAITKHVKHVGFNRVKLNPGLTLYKVP